MACTPCVDALTFAGSVEGGCHAILLRRDMYALLWVVAIGGMFLSGVQWSSSAVRMRRLRRA
jgi:hypothetical protein